MNTKDYTSLQVSQQLHKAGVKMETDVMWANYDMGKTYELVHGTGKPNRKRFYDFAPAYSTAQLAEELPKLLKPDDEDFLVKGYGLEIRFNSYDEWVVSYRRDGGMLNAVFHKSFPDALGLITAYLLENGLMNK